MYRIKQQMSLHSYCVNKESIVWKVPKHLPRWALYRKPAGQCWLEAGRFDASGAGGTVVEDIRVKLGLDILIHWKLPCVFTQSSSWVHFNWFSAHSFISERKRKNFGFNTNILKLWMTDNLTTSVRHTRTCGPWLFLH